jgi:hypothetical protein
MITSYTCYVTSNIILYSNKKIPYHPHRLVKTKKGAEVNITNYLTNSN